MVISEYIESKYAWSETTKRSVQAKLNTLVKFDWTNPATACSELEKLYMPYTVRQYMIIAADYYGGKVAEFWRKNSYKFRHAYKEKQKKLDAEAFEAALTLLRTTDPDLYNFAVLCGRLGLRRQEALNAKYSDIVAHNGFSLLRVVGKGNKERLVPFSRGLLLSLETTAIAGKYANLKPHRVHESLKRVLPGFSSHDLRALYVTELSARLSLKEVAILVGHSSVQTTERYVRTDLNEIVKKMEVA